MRLIPPRAWALVVLSALLQIFIFPVAGAVPFWRVALCWFALIPLLLALMLPDRKGNPLKWRHAALLGYVCGILWYGGNCYWIFQTMHLYGGLPQAVSLLILILFALYLGLYHALFAWLFAVTGTVFPNQRASLLLTPFAWVAVELARSRITCFPWDLLGYSQIDSVILTRLAPLAGVMSISFAIAALNALLASVLVRPGGQGLSRTLRHVSLWIAVAISVQYATSKKEVEDPSTPAQHAVLMQENVEVGAVGREATPLSASQALAQFSTWTLAPFNQDWPSHQLIWSRSPRAQVPATVVVWPEAPSHFFSNDPSFRDGISQLAREVQAPAIIGSLGVDRTSASARGYFLYDSASLFNAQGIYSGRYDKIHLVPWGEYIPFKEFFSFADKLTEGVGDMDRGSRRDVFSTGGHRYGVFVCYESIFGEEVRQFAANGAEVLVQISDDGWYGDSGAPWQHLNMARMRAIENHRWLLRSTNTGITTTIDPAGHMAGQAPRHVRAAFEFPFEFTPASTQTFYTRHGDWFAWLCAAGTAGALLMRGFRFPAAV